MKLTTAVIMSLAVALEVGCAGAQVVGTGETEPVVAILPNEFVMRDVRKDAAPHLNCQVPDVAVEFDRWAGSSGDVTAYGCGFRVTYYMRCNTNNQCKFTLTEPP